MSRSPIVVTSLILALLSGCSEDRRDAPTQETDTSDLVAALDAELDSPGDVPRADGADLRDGDADTGQAGGDTQGADADASQLDGATSDSTGDAPADAGADTTGVEDAAGDVEEADSADPTPIEVALMTFNIRWESGVDGPNGWAFRKDMVFDLLSSPDLDIIGLQESTPQQTADILAAVPTLAAHSTDPVMNGVVILYRPDRFALVETGTFWFSPTPDVPESTDWNSDTRRHACPWVRFRDLASDRTFTVFDLHWDIYEPSRQLSAVLLGDRVAARAEPEPWVLLGDFNAPEAEAASQFVRGEIALAGDSGVLRSIQEPAIDTYRVLHPNETNVRTGHGFNGGTSGVKIDYVYVPPGTTVLAAEIDHTNVGGAYPSDHYPVTATVQLAP